MQNRDNIYDFSSLASMPDDTDIFDEVFVLTPSNEPAKPEISIIETLENGFDVSKKFVDATDDTWNAIGRTALPPKTVESVTPYIVSSTSAIIFAFEGMEGGKLAYEGIKAREAEKVAAMDVRNAELAVKKAHDAEKLAAMKELDAKKARAADLNNPSNDTDEVVGLLTTFWSAIGYYLSISFIIVNAIGSVAGIAALALASSILSGLLTAIYSLALLRNVGKLLDANEKYAEAEKVYDNNKKSIASTDRINDVSSANHLTIVPKKYVDSAEGTRDKAFSAKLEAERNVSFKAIEVFAASLVFAATIVTAVVSFGTVPAILLGVGVGIGLACKAFEYVDAKYDHKFSNGMRRFFKNAWDYVFPEKDENKKNITHENTVAALPTPTPIPKSEPLYIPTPMLTKTNPSIQNHYTNNSPSLLFPLRSRIANNSKTAYTQISLSI